MIHGCLVRDLVFTHDNSFREGDRRQAKTKFHEENLTYLRVFKVFFLLLSVPPRALGPPSAEAVRAGESHIIFLKCMREDGEAYMYGEGPRMKLPGQLLVYVFDHHEAKIETLGVRGLESCADSGNKFPKLQLAYIFCITLS